MDLDQIEDEGTTAVSHSLDRAWYVSEAERDDTEGTTPAILRNSIAAFNWVNFGIKSI